jgi:pyruvate ferredoxin oxidoreductase alpha subunit
MTQVYKSKNLATLSSNKAVAKAVGQLDVDVIAAYPITPQTTIVEELAQMVANGEVKAQYIHVESEHSALSAVVGASIAGARTFTATSSQGLELMHEILHITSGLRLPVVMVVPTRALSAPISIWNDHSDIMNARDTGWIIYFVSSAQEAYDTVIQAYRLAEDREVLLPTIVSYDGFLMSHTYEPVVIESSEDVIEFSPKTWKGYIEEGAVAIGTLASPDYYYEFKYQQVEAMKNALRKAEIIDRDFYKKFGRKYGVVETYRTEDSEIDLLVTGSIWGSLKLAIDKARSDGLRIGGLRLRLYRPLPIDEIEKILAGKEVLVVIDKAISYGLRVAGPFANEIYTNLQSPVKIKSVVAGIGQRAVTHEDLYKVILHVYKNKDSPGFTKHTLFYGVRGVELDG